MKKLEPSTHKQHNWFNENDEKTQAFLLVKHHIHHVHQNDLSLADKKNAFTNASRIVQNKLHKMLDVLTKTDIILDMQIEMT